MDYKELSLPFPFPTPLQITAALPNNFLHKLKRWLCLLNFYFREHAMTFFVITTSFHQEKKGEKERKRRQSKKKKEFPSPQHLQTSHSALICSEMGFPLKHILCGKLCSFFFLNFIFWDIWHQSRQAGLALQLCFEPLPSSDYPTPPSFFVRVCLFFVNAISIKSLLNPSFFWGGGGRGRKGKRRFPGDCPTAGSVVRLWHRRSPRYPPRKLIQSIKNLESGAFLHVFVH